MTLRFNYSLASAIPRTCGCTRTRTAPPYTDKTDQGPGLMGDGKGE